MDPQSHAAVRHARDRLARRAAPFVWAEAARRMAERLELLRLQPELVLDLGCAWGDALGLLRARYPRARIVGVEPSPRLAEVASRAHARRGLFGGRLRASTEVVTGAIGAPPALDAAPQMLWSNLALPWAGPATEAFAAWHRALAPEGVLMFTTFGPDTLRELRRPELRELGIVVPEFPDMHDLGDMLVHEGWADPVMDMEMLRLRYPSADAALRELAELGRPPHAAAAPGLRTRRAWDAARAVLDAGGGGVELSFELVYGHAFRPATRRARDGEAAFPLDALRATARKR